MWNNGREHGRCQGKKGNYDFCLLEGHLFVERMYTFLIISEKGIIKNKTGEISSKTGWRVFMREI
jgi:hypothetical protein